MRKLAILAVTAAACGSVAVVPALAAPVADSTAAGQPRIVGGTASKQGDYPWMVHITLPAPGWKLWCGGTLISKDIVLTAQHCVAWFKTFTVRYGDILWAKGTVVNSKKFIAGKGLKQGDWAVLKLDTPVELPTYPTLPASGQWNDTPIQRTMGWGVLEAKDIEGPAELREVDLPVVTFGVADCTVEGDLCMGDLDKGGIDSCQGDSGGPLVAKHDATWVQTGIVSWGNGCGDPGKPGHYTKISHYASEIRWAIDQLGGTQPHWAPSIPAPQPTPGTTTTRPPVPDPVPSPDPSATRPTDTPTPTFTSSPAPSTAR